MKKTGLFLLILCLSMSGCSLKDPQKNVVSHETEQETEKATENNIDYRTLLVSDKNDEMYTYEDMEQDLDTLSLAYDDLANVKVLGTTLDNRNIYDLIIGDEEAENHVIIHASIHAREYITTKLVMRQAADYLKGLSDGSGSYKNTAYAELSENTAIHVIPMVNPDGVTLCQKGIEGIKTDAARTRITEIITLDGGGVDSTDFTQWKANANGVDLNRNYDAKWNEYEGPNHPSSDHYKGEAPGSEPETKALMDLTENNPVKRTISYHTYGEVVYWYFGQSGALYDVTKNWADDVSAITGYITDPNYMQLDPAGYKDWAISKKGIPSLTIEVGHGQNPVPEAQFDDIKRENKDIWAEVLYNIKLQSN